jgi:two-component system NtrC family sensor kinase
MSTFLETARHRILVIDDNPAIHADFRKVLTPARDDGEYAQFTRELFGRSDSPPGETCFELDAACQGEEGLECLLKALSEGRPYSVAFVDVRMPPGWDGIETISRLWEASPELQVVLCTAYSDYSWTEMIERIGQSDRLLILKKPFDNVEVLQLTHALARKWALTRETVCHVADLDKKVQQRTEELQAANQELQRQLTERQQLEQQLRQAQKMEAIGQLAGGVAHDFNNLLAVIRGNAELVLMDPNALKEEAADCLGQIVAASERAANLTRQLLAFSRKQVLRSQPVNLNTTISNLTKMLKRMIGEDIELRENYAPQLPLVQADPGMVEQVLINLVVNARDAMPQGGHVIVATESIRLDEVSSRTHPDARPGEFIMMSVADCGSGIRPEHLSRIFEPFFTTKDVGRGTGLGLATVYGIVKQHRGWVEVSSKVGAGSKFSVFLPALAVAVAQAGQTSAPARPVGGNETILLVEDDDAVRDLTRRLLEGFGYRVRVATSGRRALELGEEHLAQVDLVLTDVIMPDGVNGQQLVEQFRAMRPGLKVIFMSGYSGDALGKQGAAFHKALDYFLQKPCKADEIARTVRRCLDDKESKATGAVTA